MGANTTGIAIRPPAFPKRSRATAKSKSRWPSISSSCSAIRPYSLLLRRDSIQLRRDSIQRVVRRVVQERLAFGGADAVEFEFVNMADLQAIDRQPHALAIGTDDR